MQICESSFWLLGMKNNNTIKSQKDSIYFYLYSAESQLKSAQGTLHIEQVQTVLFVLDRVATD